MQNLFMNNNFRKLFRAFVAVMLFAISANAALDSKKFKQLYESKQYFDLRDEVASHSEKSRELEFYRGVVANKFNRLTLAVDLFQRYISRSPRGGDDELILESYKLLADSYVRTYQYEKASETYQRLFEKHSIKIDSADMPDFENAFRISTALAGTPRQSVAVDGNSVIRTSRNLVGMQIPVEVASQTVPFTLDTGAGMSAITHSLAIKLRFRIVEASIDVGGTTGAKVKSRLGIAPEMKMGKVLLKNVVFLVFEDKDLFLPQANYQINAILGMPAIEAVKEITFSKNGEVFIPAKPERQLEQNLCFEDSTPLLAARYGDKRMAFVLDTGANSSTFYLPFFSDFQSDVMAEGTKQQSRVAGVGGSKEISIYRMKEVLINVNNKPIRLPNLKVLTDATNGRSKYFYGNLGRDLLDRFSKMTLNFESMSATFEL